MKKIVKNYRKLAEKLSKMGKKRGKFIENCDKMLKTG